MRLSRQLLAILALVSLAQASKASRSLHDFCLDLKQAMASNTRVFDDPEAALEEARKHLETAANKLHHSRVRLIQAWEIVARNGPCDELSGAHVSTIALCQPTEKDSMRTLLKAVKSYSNKCLTSDFWDRQLKKKLGGAGDKTGLSNFLSARFIELYQADNPGEKMLYFAPVKEETCCRPDRAHRALLVALDPIVGDQNAVKLMIKASRRKFDNLMQRFLFKPCNSYVLKLYGLVAQAANARAYFHQGPEAFVESLSQEFQDALFRYKFCAYFHPFDDAFAKTRSLRLAGFWQVQKNN